MTDLTPPSDPNAKRPSESSSSSSSTNVYHRPYTGPTVRDMIANHTVAENIIKYHFHPTSSPILNDRNLDLLRRFVSTSSDQERARIMKEADFEGKVDEVTGIYGGDLTGYLILRNQKEIGESVEPVLTNEEIEVLKDWFDGGMKEISDEELSQRLVPKDEMLVPTGDVPMATDV